MSYDKWIRDLDILIGLEKHAVTVIRYQDKNGKATREDLEGIPGGCTGEG